MKKVLIPLLGTLAVGCSFATKTSSQTLSRQEEKICSLLPGGEGLTETDVIMKGDRPTSVIINDEFIQEAKLPKLMDIKDLDEVVGRIYRLPQDPRDVEMNFKDGTIAVTVYGNNDEGIDRSKIVGFDKVKLSSCREHRDE